MVILFVILKVDSSKVFLSKINFCYIFWVELWELRLSIKITKLENLTSVIFELDYAIVINMINSGSTSNLHLQPLLQKVIFLLWISDWRKSIIHIF